MNLDKIIWGIAFGTIPFMILFGFVYHILNPIYQVKYAYGSNFAISVNSTFADSLVFIMISLIIITLIFISMCKDTKGDIISKNISIEK